MTGDALNILPILRSVVLAVVTLEVSGIALAEDGKVYKSVDKSGKITYSQTPPLDAKSEKVTAKPAIRGSASGGAAQAPYEDWRYAPYQPPYYPPVSTIPQPISPQQQRQAQLQAECERNRGTDCGNPATLQYLDSTTIPRRGRY